MQKSAVHMEKKICISKKCFQKSHDTIKFSEKRNVHQYLNLS